MWDCYVSGTVGAGHLPACLRSARAAPMPRVLFLCFHPRYTYKKQRPVSAPLARVVATIPACKESTCDVDERGILADPLFGDSRLFQDGPRRRVKGSDCFVVLNGFSSGWAFQRRGHWTRTYFPSRKAYATPRRPRETRPNSAILVHL